MDKIDDTGRACAGRCAEHSAISRAGEAAGAGDTVQRRVAVLGVAHGGHDLPALLKEVERRLKTDAAGGTCDQDCLADAAHVTPRFLEPRQAMPSLCQFHPISPVPLGPVERGVGGLQDGLAVLAVRRKHGHTK